MLLHYLGKQKTQKLRLLPAALREVQRAGI